MHCTGRRRSCQVRTVATKLAGRDFAKPASRKLALNGRMHRWSSCENTLWGGTKAGGVPHFCARWQAERPVVQVHRELNRTIWLGRGPLPQLAVAMTGQSWPAMRVSAKCRTISASAQPKRNRRFFAPTFAGSFCLMPRWFSTWWAGLDSNQRRRKPTDLQSAPFSHSGTPPGKSSIVADFL